MVAFISYSTAKIAIGLHGVSHPSLYIPYQLPRHVKRFCVYFSVYVLGAGGWNTHACG